MTCSSKPCIGLVEVLGTDQAVSQTAQQQPVKYDFVFFYFFGGYHTYNIYMPVPMDGLDCKLLEQLPS